MQRHSINNSSTELNKANAQSDLEKKEVGGNYAIDNRSETIAQRQMLDMISTHNFPKITAPKAVLQKMPAVVGSNPLTENKLSAISTLSVPIQLNTPRNNDNDPKKDNQSNSNTETNTDTDTNSEEPKSVNEEENNQEPHDEIGDAGVQDKGSTDVDQNLPPEIYSTKPQKGNHSNQRRDYYKDRGGAGGGATGIPATQSNSILSEDSKQQLQRKLEKYESLTSININDANNLGTEFFRVLSLTYKGHKSHGSNFNRSQSLKAVIKNLIDGIQNATLKAELIKWLNSKYTWDLV